MCNCASEVRFAPRNDGGESLNRIRFRASMPPCSRYFRGGQSGAWRVTRVAPVKGAGLARTPALSVVHSLSIALPILPSITSWRLAGVASHVRYVERAEKDQLVAVQAGLGRPEATSRGADPDQEIRGVVGADAGRAAADL